MTSIAAMSIFSEEVQAALAEIGEALELDSRLRPFDSYRYRDETGEIPTLHLDDVSAIPFLDGIAGVEEYQHRARIRATAGDLVATVTESLDGYEDYCRGLGLGGPQLVLAEAAFHPTEVARACGEGEAFSLLTKRAKAADGLTIHPYMGTDDVWALARKLAEASMVPVNVLAPPPPVTWIANDKIEFFKVVRAILGDEFLPAEVVVSSSEQIRGALETFSRRYQTVGIKRARCASAMGNLVVDAKTLVEGGPGSFLNTAHEFATTTEWKEGMLASVVEWVDASSSPSTQLWVPPLGRGPVVVDGIYEQILAGQSKVFVGSRPSTLPAELNQRLAAAATAVATGLQRFGYVGRCSFDHLLVGDVRDSPRVLFAECNGRWGGTSTPMHLVDRLVGRDGDQPNSRAVPRPTYRAQDVVSDKLVGARLPEILEALGQELFSPRSQTPTSQGSIVLYNVGPLTSSGKLDVIAFGDSPEAADEVMLERLPKLLGFG